MYYLNYIGQWQWIIIISTLVLFILPIIALIDIIKSDFKGNNKLIWVIIVIFLTLPGIILYYAIGRSQKISQAVEKDNNIDE